MIFCEDPTDAPSADWEESHTTLYLATAAHVQERAEWLEEVQAAVQHEEDRFGPQVRLVQG